MATFTATLAIVQTIEIEYPDSQVEALLEDECKLITDYVATTFVGKSINHRVTTMDDNITVGDYSDIATNNGGDYVWDGECLIEL